MFRLSKNFTHEESAAHMAFFKKMVKEVDPHAGEEAAARRARKAAAKRDKKADAKAKKAANRLAQAMRYLRNTGSRAPNL